jgi:LacI family transcriptional regulator
MKRRSVALLIETSNAYSRGLLEGMVQYIREHEAWSIYLPEQERAAKPPAWISRWKGDGILARIETAEIAKAIRKTHRPVVDLSSARYLPEVPWVETNDDAIAQLAAEHLLLRGFKAFAFAGDPSFQWSKLRCEAFQKYVEAKGFQCHIYEGIPSFDDRYSWTREQRRLSTWLKSLAKPIGIMACYDIKAQQLLDVCRELEIAVPEQIAIIGVDNDEVLCNLADPPLSSVISNSHRAGYMAASVLDRMMSGESIAARSFLFDPIGIATRQSTDVLAIDDADIASALRFIRTHFMSGINVNDVVKQIPLSRRVFESRFLDLLGRTPHEEIVRLRIDRVKQLLLETDLSLSTIATRTGFRHEEYLSAAFKRIVGTAPSRFRRETGR